MYSRFNRPKMTSLVRFIYVLIFLAFVLCLMWVRIVFNAIHSKDERVTQIEANSNIERTTLIYVDALYSPFHLWKNDCQYTCDVTSDVNLWSVADMAVWNLIFPKDPIPRFKGHANQIWVANAYYESPKFNGRTYRKHANRIKGLVDYTYTYRYDSDIVERRIDYEQKRSSVKEYYEERQGGDLFVSWFVSNCGPQERLRYYKAMNEAMNEDEKHRTNVYGKCFNNDLKHCGSTRNSYSSQNQTCVSEHLKRYKFYLGFENSRCRDYITEKTGIALQHGAIPIVMGGMERRDYERALPPNSFINIDDFESPKLLVEYLRYLDKNDTAYGEYFKWQKEYKMTGIGWGSSSAYTANIQNMCTLCAIASGHYRIPKRGPEFDFSKWWIDGQCH